MSSDAPSWLSELLNEESFLKNHSYYKNVRHNHKAHAAVALSRLGASEEHVKRFIGIMNQYIEPYNPNEPLTEMLEIDYLKSSNLRDYRGHNQGFYTMLRMYEEIYNTKYNGDIMKMIKEVCAELIDGPLYSAFHGMIQIAYGYHGNCNRAILEGIVFMDQQYSPMFGDDMGNVKRTDLSRFGYGKCEILDVMKRLREDTKLVSDLREENARDMPLRVDTHMKGVFGWPVPKYHSDTFLDAVDDIKFPAWFDPKKKDMEQFKKLLDWFGDMFTVVYVRSNAVNDFFILHGVTVAWCAQQVLPLFDFDTAMLGLRGMVAAVFAVYLMQGAPGLDHEPEEYYKGEISQEVWDGYIKETLSGKDYEIHVYKVIQCLYEAWKKHPNSDYAKYYMAGAHLVRNNCYAGISPDGVLTTFPNDDLSA